MGGAGWPRAHLHAAQSNESGERDGPEVVIEQDLRWWQTWVRREAAVQVRTSVGGGGVLDEVANQSKQRKTKEGLREAAASHSPQSSRASARDGAGALRAGTGCTAAKAGHEKGHGAGWG